MAVYVVFVGRSPGIYKRWELCEAQISGISNAVFCKFDKTDDAVAAFMRFGEDKSWCYKNPVHICSLCKKCIQFKISRVKKNIGSHYFACQTVDCEYSIGAADLRNNLNTEGAQATSSYADSSEVSILRSKVEALEDLVRGLAKINVR